MRILRKVDCFAALAMTVLAYGPAWADQKGNCGTIVLPTGIGVSSSADITSMNPLLGTSTYNAEIAGLMYLPLFWINRFQQIDWSRSLASAVNSPDNGTTYDVTLRDWHWSDGVKVSTADVIYTLDLIKELGSTYPGYGLGGMPDIIKSITAVDATHLVVVLTRRVNPTWFIYNGLWQLEPLPRHAWGRYDLDQIWQDQSSPAFFDVVDGPLKVTALNMGLDVALAPNPRYEGPKLHFDRMVFKFLGTDGAALQDIEAGDLDLVNVPMPVWNAVQTLPGIYRVTLPAGTGWNNIMLNFHNKAVAFFNDLPVRQAMQDAIDQGAIIALADHGLGVADYGPVPTVQTNFLSPAMRAGQYPVGYDPGKAAALLRDAGYSRGADGIMAKHGVRLSFVDLLPAQDEQLEQEAEILQSDFLRAGIEMKIHELDFNELLALTAGPPGGWEAAEFAETANNYPSGESMFATGGYYNQGGYSDAKMDALIDDSVNRPGLDGLFRFEDYAAAQQPVIFFETDGVAVLALNRIHGIEDFVNPAGWFAPDQLYCTGKKS